MIGRRLVDGVRSGAVCASAVRAGGCDGENAETATRIRKVLTRDSTIAASCWTSRPYGTFTFWKNTSS
jgi:hypothetical protein